MTAPRPHSQPVSREPRVGPNEPATPGPWEVSDILTVEGEYMVVGGIGQEFGLIASCPVKADAELICRLRGSGVLTDDAIDDALSEYWDTSQRGWAESQRVAMRKAVAVALSSADRGSK